MAKDMKHAVTRLGQGILPLLAVTGLQACSSVPAPQAYVPPRNSHALATAHAAVMTARLAPAPATSATAIMTANYLPLGAPIAAPMGFLELCQRSPADCSRSRQADVTHIREQARADLVKRYQVAFASLTHAGPLDAAVEAPVVTASLDTSRPAALIPTQMYLKWPAQAAQPSGPRTPAISVTGNMASANTFPMQFGQFSINRIRSERPEVDFVTGGSLLADLVPVQSTYRLPTPVIDNAAVEPGSVNTAPPKDSETTQLLGWSGKAASTPQAEAVISYDNMGVDASNRLATVPTSMMAPNPNDWRPSGPAGVQTFGMTARGPSAPVPRPSLGLGLGLGLGPVSGPVSGGYSAEPYARQTPVAPTPMPKPRLEASRDYVRIDMTRQNLALIQSINVLVNRTLQQATDDAIYHVSDYWTAPGLVNGAKADCEDFALQKRRELIKAGIPAGALTLAIVRTWRDDVHAVLIVSAVQGDYVLDNLQYETRPWRRSGYTWISRQAPGDGLGWVSLASANAFGSNAGNIRIAANW